MRSKTAIILSLICALLSLNSCGSSTVTHLEEKIAFPTASEQSSVPGPHNSPSRPLPQSNIPGTPPVVTAGASPAKAAHLPPTLYVVVSGAGTCNFLHYRDRMAGLIKTGLFSGFINSMMESGYVRENDNVIFACYEGRSSVMKVYDLHHRPEMVNIDQAQLDVIVIPQAIQYARTVIIGHSYGGWRSMKLAASPQFQQVKRGPISLITVDPISKANCRNPIDRDCREAPSDFTEAELFNLNKGTHWLNAVQEPGIIIGSDSMSAAHINLKFTGSNHLSIASDERVWKAISDFLF